MSDKKLFIVEFGEPHQQNMFSFGGGSSIRPIYVVAKDYTGASVKASMWLQNHIETNPEQRSILDGDGSLKPNMDKPTDMQIISVKLLSDEIIY